MRIGFFYPHIGTDGGYPRDVRHLADALERLGHSVYRCTHLRQLLGEPLDLVHVFGIFLPSNPLASILCRFRDVPVVISPLSHLEPDALAYHRKRKRLFLGLGGLAAFRRVSAVHCFSSNEADVVRKLVPEVPTMSGTLGCFFEDLPRSIGDSFPGMPSKPYFLFFGRMDLYQKGLDLLLDAFSAVASEGRLSNVELVLAGVDWKNSHAAIRRRLATSGLEAHVRLLGEVSAEQKYILLKHCDLFVYPSRFDGPPRPVREALALGRPVLISRQANMPDELESWGWARHFDARGGDLVSHLRRVLSGDLPGPVGPEDVRRRLSWDVTARQYAAAYERLR